MTPLSDNHLIVAIQGINDAVRYNHKLLESETLVSSADQEEYLFTLSELASYLRAEYQKRAAENKSLPAYAKLVPEASEE